MLKSLPAVLTLLILTGGGAFAQSNLRPDSTLRVPPLPGQELPLQDKAFLSHAANLSGAEIDAGRICAEKAQDPEVRALGADLVAYHTKLLQAVNERAAEFKAETPASTSGQPWDADLKALSGVSGKDLDRECLRWYWRSHLALVQLYQTQASQTPEHDLAKFAIISLADIQSRFDRVKPLGAKYDLSTETVGQPPQY